VEEYADPNPEQAPAPAPAQEQEYYEHVIIIDGNMTSSDDEDYEKYTHT
jgi:hypothetical protein